MNGSRSNPLRQGENPSIDALNRTIQGLEARIEGLMVPARDPRPRSDFDRAADSVSEIMLRQRSLANSRVAVESNLPRDERSIADEVRARLPMASGPVQNNAGIKTSDAAMQDIAQALVGLRHELKKDITEGVSREVQNLRAEIRGIKPSAQDQNFAVDMRDDLAKLAESINRLGHQASPSEAAGLRAEFNDLRSVIDGLAREDSLRHLETRWTGVEEKLNSFNPAALQEDLLSLAYQLDDIKSHMGSMGGGPAIQALENRLISLAHQIESMGAQMQPNDRVIAEQFAGLDLRLDEISRAIASASRAPSNSFDPQILRSFESKINQLADAIELVQQPQVDRTIAPRIEALAQRVEELLGTASATRLDERLDQLSRVMENSVRSDNPPELAFHLSDISRKIDALDTGSVNNELAKQLGFLARRIEEFTLKPQPVHADSTASMTRLEDRLDDIAARLDYAVSAPQASSVDVSAFQNLEAQIANLSDLLHNSQSASTGVAPEFEHRMAALEDYIATSDEYIMQAARQAAEAVAEAYGRHTDTQGASTGVDLAMFHSLSEDLQQLEEITRSSEQRTHKTFAALHDTLVQIAHRLDSMDGTVATRGRENSQNAAPQIATPVAAQNTRQFQEDDYASEMEMALSTASKQTSVSDRYTERTADPMALVEFARQDFTRLQAETEMQFEKQTRTMQQSIVAPDTQRAIVQPPPSTDAIEVYQPSAEDSLLLEPGSGVPDVKKILAKVRASQNANAAPIAPGKLSDSEKADFISAARRAAREAAAEIENSAVEAPTRGNSKMMDAKPQSLISKNRRALMLTAGVVVLGILAYPMLKTFVLGKPSPAQIEMSQTANDPEAKPADANVAADAPNMAEQKTEAEKTPMDATADAAPKPMDATDGAEPKIEAAESTEKPAAEDAMAPAAALPGADEGNGMAEAEQPAMQPAVSVVDVPDNVGPPTLVTAARSGDPLALFEIGARFTDGRGVKSDLVEAAKWYQQAADKGQPVAQYRLANFYEKGTGVQRDIAKAKELYEKSAEQGNASAMHNLAVLSATGADGKPDMISAGKWFKQAADLGVKDSQFNLAILYARGTGVPADLSESYKWFAIAARDGDADAGQKRDEVAKAMKPDQLAGAKAKVDAWKKEPVNDAANNPIVPDEWIGKGNTTSSIDMKKAITNIQAILNNNGYNVGKPDGKMGAKTVAAIKSFQTSVGQNPTGEITDALVKELLARNKKT